MSDFLRKASSCISAAALLTSLTAMTPTKAEAAFNVDCAMLLCLAGGFPESVECGLAYATLIRRITPYPIEPPLQIWRCPLGASYDETPLNKFQRVYEATFPMSPMQSTPIQMPDVTQPIPVSLRTQHSSPDLGSIVQLIAGDQADIDISDPTYDFIRSIRVFQIYIRDDKDSESEGGSCTMNASVIIGSYGQQGDFDWARATNDRRVIPAAYGATSNGCRFNARSVFIEWRDFEGGYDSARVDY